MSIIINLFLMAYLLVMVVLSILTLFWATLLIFKPLSTTKERTGRAMSMIPERTGCTE
ncbi:MAG: hypothetical protein HKP12_02530 [Gammaproteobacteria bacterium]|nr:hypothetical protein [Gammaproteobacteria bacterium]NNJ96013.1 hypothetical protein [Gammaproteobacteria bacterium]